MLFSQVRNKPSLTSIAETDDMKRFFIHGGRSSQEKVLVSTSVCDSFNSPVGFKVTKRIARLHFGWQNVVAVELTLLMTGLTRKTYVNFLVL